MSVLNKLDCATPTANTGVSDCALDIAAIAFGIAVPGNFEIPASQLATKELALAYLQNAVIENNQALRIFPLPKVFNFTDNSEDATFQTGSTGVNAFVRDGKYDWMFQFTEGGFCLLQEIQKLNGSGKKYLFVDEAGVLFGTRTATNGLAGIPLNFFRALPWKANDGSNLAIYSYRINFNAAYVNYGNAAFIKFNFAEVASLNGLLNVALSQLALRSAAVMQVGANVSCGGADLYEQYATELASVAAWTASIAGKTVTITSVVANPNLRGWTITLDATDPDYNANAPVLVNLSGPSDLDQLGVSGYAGIPKLITTI